MKIIIVVCALFLVVAGCAATGSKTSPELDAAASGQRNPAAAEAARNLGEAYLAGGNLIAALQQLKRAEMLNPEDHITMYDIGLVYYYRGRYDQAVEYLQQAIKLKPGYAPAINSLGNAYSAMGEWDKAIEAYERIIEDAFYGTPHFALSNMALAYYNKKDFDQAERHFQEALKMNPDFINALGGLGILYIEQGRYEEAVSKLERAVRKEPKAAQLRFELGRAYLGVGDKARAKAEFARAAELAPDTPLAADALRELRKIP
ncbi:MAG: tetratricopeptide repeat protein [Desulfobacterales bacterium]